MVEVSHKDDNVWVSDGKMTQEAADKHVERCEYKQHNIEYKIVPVKKAAKKKKAVSTNDESEGEKSE